MATQKLKEVRNVNYLSKDFDSIKLNLMEFIQQNFRNDFQDFNEASGGMALLEMLAYVGDLMSFYIDRQANETFINRAVEEKNIIGLSKTLGRKPRFVTPATVDVSISAVMTKATSAQSLFVINKGTRVSTELEPAVSFEIIEDVDFSLTANRTVTSDATFVTASISGVSAVAGQSRTFVYTVGAGKSFLEIELPNEDITEVISITSSDGNEWTEVDHLAQDTIMFGENNDTSTSGNTPFVLKAKRVPRRYTVERETAGRTLIRFGSGKLTLEDSEVIINPEDFVLPPTLRGSASGFTPPAINAAQFLDTKSLGFAPANISLDVNYRFGGGLETNVGSNQLTRFRERTVTYKTANFESLSAEEVNVIEHNMKVSNAEQATGGSERESLEEMRENAAAFFSAQNRAVTLQDYQVLVRSLPACFGSVFRAHSRKDPENALGVELFLISRDTDNRLMAPGGTLKNNIGVYINKFKSFSDSVKLSDGKIINIKTDFSIVPEPNVNGNEALLEALLELRRVFDITNSNFNDFIVIPDIVSRIQSIDKIRSVASFNITNITGSLDGRTYSNVAFNIAAHTNNGILRFPEYAIWETRFLDFDIIGRVI